MLKFFTIFALAIAGLLAVPVAVPEAASEAEAARVVVRVRGIGFRGRAVRAVVFAPVFAVPRVAVIVR